MPRARRPAVTPMCPSQLLPAIAEIFPGATPVQSRQLALVALDHAAWWLRHAREGDRLTVSGRPIWDDPEDAA